MGEEVAHERARDIAGLNGAGHIEVGSGAHRLVVFAGRPADLARRATTKIRSRTQEAS